MLYLLFFCCKNTKSTILRDFSKSEIDLFFPLLDFSKCLLDESAKDLLNFLQDRDFSQLNKHKVLQVENRKCSKYPHITG